MNKYYAVIVIGLFLVLLSGCLYPQNQLAKNQMPNEAQIEMVQSAVNAYQEETNGLVPIKTKANDVDLYEKYLIDFSLLKDHQHITEIPGTAYENGGIYQYTLLTPEEDPQVKLIDLRLSETIRDLNTKIHIYRTKNTYPPFGKQVANGVYQINYEKLGYQSEPFVVSPFSQHNLPLVLNEDGEVFIDYRIDLRQALEEYDHTFQEGDDIRSILHDHSPFVPAYSLPFTLIDGEPTFLIE